MVVVVSAVVVAAVVVVVAISLADEFKITPSDDRVY